MAAGNSNPTAKLAHMKKMRAGIAEKFPDQAKVIAIKGVEAPVSTWLTKLDGYIGLWQAAETAHEDVVTTVSARDKAEPEVDTFLDDLRDAVVPFFGRSSQQLKAMGVSPRKERKKSTAKATVARTSKATLTRELRHTMGKRQKKDVKAGSAEQSAPSNNGVSQGTEPSNGGTTASPTPEGTGK